jgi:hypothetical protein
MKPISKFDPIFVHASPRSGSTYFFNVLRRNDSLMCFNEAIMDGKRDYARFKDPKERERFRKEAAKWNVNHHFLDRDEFDEFIEAWDEVMHLCPEFPSFIDYLPANGVLENDLKTYLAALMDYARGRNKLPVLCEINSRGRAGALREAFGGYHIAQYRDPLSQFGSFMRGLVDGGGWGFLVTPLTELGASAGHPLFRLIPEQWRAPVRPWRAETRAQFWSSAAHYTIAAASAQPQGIENLFRWHMFSWLLCNLAAVSYSDLAIDIDRVYEDRDHRAAVAAQLAAAVGQIPDFSDIKKFDRFYAFESFDVATVCRGVMSVVRTAAADGRLASAVRALSSKPPMVETETAVAALTGKIEASMAAMAASSNRRTMSAAEWRELAERNRRIWFNPGVRWVAEHMYPVVAPIVRTVRRAGVQI